MTNATKERLLTDQTKPALCFLKAGIVILEVISVPFHIAGQGNIKFVLVRTEFNKTLAVKLSDIEITP